MALIDVECTDESCAKVTENVWRRAADWQFLPPCEVCGKPTIRVFLPPKVRWQADPVVVFQAEDGTYRFPGDANGLSAANYQKLGYRRVELRNFADVRQFERRVNEQERSRGARRVESEHRGRELRESEGRQELFAKMKTMSNMGRDVAKAAIATGNARPQPRSHDPGFRVEVYSDDRSNRDASRGADGRRRRD